MQGMDLRVIPFYSAWPDAWWAEGKLVRHLGPDLVLRAVHRAADCGLLPLGHTGAAASAPGCAAVLKLHDAVCTGWGTELEFPELAVASEATMRDRVGGISR